MFAVLLPESVARCICIGKIINNKTIGKIAYFSKKNVKSVEIKYIYKV